MLTVTIARGKSRIECTGVHNVNHGRERTGGEKGRVGKGKPSMILSMVDMVNKY